MKRSKYSVEIFLGNYRFVRAVVDALPKQLQAVCISWDIDENGIVIKGETRQEIENAMIKVQSISKWVKEQGIK